MAYTFSFIGTGNMGGALARAAVRSLPFGSYFIAKLGSMHAC